MNRLLFCATLSIALSLPAFAQNNSRTTGNRSETPTKENVTGKATEKADYSRDAVVIEHYSDNSRFENDGTGIRHVSSRMRIQTEAGVKQFGLLLFTYDKGSETLEIGYVRVRKPDGSVVVTPQESMQDLPAEVTREAPLYSDIRQRHVNVVALRPGDVLEYEVTFRTTSPLVPGHFWFDGDFTKEVIILDEQIVLDVPAGRKIALKVQDGLHAEVKEQNGRKIYTWTGSNLKHEEPKQDENGDEEAALTEPAIQATSFENWDEFGHWFTQIEKDRVAPSAEVKEKALELTKGLSSDREKVQAIYNFVAKEIRYVGLEFGIGKFQAHASSVVLANRYGDCKDKHTLLASMLSTIGIEADPVLIHTNRKLLTDLASPAEFNHVITSVKLGEDRVLLDTTSEVAPFGMLVATIRDKQALMVKPTGKPEVVKTPADPPFASFSKLESDGTVDGDDKVTADVVQTLRGDEELLFRAAFRGASPEKWKDVAQALAYVSGFSGTVSDVTVSDVEDTNTALRVKYHYVHETYVTWDKNQGQMRVVLPMMGLPAVDALTKSKDGRIQLGSPTELIYKSKIRIPPDTIAAAPRAVTVTSAFGDYKSTYKLDKNVIFVERSLKTKKRDVRASEKDEYKTFVEALAKDNGRDVEIARNGASPRSDAEEDASAQPQVGDEAFHAGVAASERGDLLLAASKYQEATKQNPKHPYAWGELARVRARMGDLDNAVIAGRKQLEVNPKHPDANLIVATIQLIKGDKVTAAAAFRAQLAVNPDDTRGQIGYAGLLQGEKNYKEAVPHLEAATSAGITDPRVRSALVQCYLKTGALEKALKVAEEIASSDDAGDLNTAAYLLADNDAHLGRALEWSQKSVEKISAELSKVDLSNITDDDLRKMNELTAAWDTLGWTYAKLGNFEQARAYLYAAWTFQADKDSAAHLAYVYEKQKMSAKSAEYKHLAAAKGAVVTMSYTTPFLPGSRPGPNKLNVLNKADFIAQDRLQDMRTVKLRAVKGAGSAEFLVLFSAAGIEDVKFLSGSESLQGAASALKSAKYEMEFPDKQGAKIVRRGILSCGDAGPCLFVMLEQRDVKSVN